MFGKKKFVIEMLFEELDTGDFFEHLGDEYQKTSDHYVERYGNSNCRLVTERYYKGDAGHRFMHRINIVRKRKGE